MPWTVARRSPKRIRPVPSAITTIAVHLLAMRDRDVREGHVSP
ncbi:hypothetical protein [Streptomyces sp. P3]|nr:hypothetical protein [Streptomyces sp. P3]